MNKTQNLIRNTLGCALLIAMSGAAADADKITVEETTSWWQWALDIPSSVHPLSLKPTIDPTGKDYCMVGQQGGVWNLGGIFKVVDPIPDAAVAAVAETSELEPFVVERVCRIPLGQEILIPVLNVECNTAEEIALGNLDPDASLGEKITYLREDCAKAIADLITEHEASFGPEGGDLKALDVARVASKQAFQVTFSPDNILSSEDFFQYPEPNPSLAQVDGYWAKVKPKKTGNYVLKTYGAVPAFDFALDITYQIEVVVEGSDSIFE